MKERFRTWRDNSVKQNDEEFVIDKLLYHPDDICVCMVCTHYKLSERMIEKIYFITAGLYKGFEDHYNSEDLDKLMEFHWNYKTNKEAAKEVEKILDTKRTGVYVSEEECPIYHIYSSILEKYMKILKGKDTYEKVDWKAIFENQNISQKFIDRYPNKFIDRTKGASESFIPQGRYYMYTV